ncbi:hypothetical protein Purlil1_8136 [Purpureocillium lilacinum]|uniref:Uncharacterized protein n=1 Tax=Purpureocillium lilacinum TaxID=33203 RepID=A0ABR0BUI1_PURLI|nr:hypothetical protein Purlil1_8136 [Purpureocillium lilacinum]
MPAITQVRETTTDHALFSSRQLSGARVDALAGRTTTTTTRSIHRIPAIFVADVSRSQAPSMEAFGPIRTKLSGPGSRKDRVVDGARMWQPQVPAGVVVVPGSSERQTGHFRGQRPCDRQIRGAPGPSSAVVPRRTGAQRALTFSFACSCEGVARRGIFVWVALFSAVAQQKRQDGVFHAEGPSSAQLTELKISEITLVQGRGCRVAAVPSTASKYRSNGVPGPIHQPAAASAATTVPWVPPDRLTGRAPPRNLRSGFTHGGPPPEQRSQPAQQAQHHLLRECANTRQLAARDPCSRTRPGARPGTLWSSSIHFHPHGTDTHARMPGGLAAVACADRGKRERHRDPRWRAAVHECEAEDTIASMPACASVVVARTRHHEQRQRGAAEAKTTTRASELGSTSRRKNCVCPALVGPRRGGVSSKKFLG